MMPDLAAALAPYAGAHLPPDLAADLPADLGRALLPMILAYARIQACILSMPATGEGFLPARVRIALAMALTPLFAGPALPVPGIVTGGLAGAVGALPGGAAAPAAQGLAAMLAGADLPGPVALGAQVATEIVVGLVIGLSVRVIAMSLDVAATALAQAASLSQVMGVSPDMPPHPIGGVLHLAGLAVLMAIGLPVHLARLIADSLAVFPPGAMPDADQLADRLVPLVGHAFVLALVLASPFVLGGFLFQALSGVVARVMPALPISLITAPAAIMATLAVLAILTPQILELWAEQVLAAGLPP